MQYVTDTDGKKTAVLIPLEEWVRLKETYNIPNDDYKVPEWQQELVSERLASYKKNPESALLFDEVITAIERKYS